MENPFIFGKAVMGRHFVDREDDIAELKSALLSGQSIVLFSPRKMGKTSLILEMFRQVEKARCVYIDLWQINSTHELASRIINRVVAATYTSIERLGRDLKFLLKSIRPKISLERDNRISLEFTKEESKDTLIDSLDFAERVAKKKGIKIIVAFDEFQEIERLDGLRLERLFRSTLQHHKHVSYIFAGSERNLIEVIFGEKNQPFYRFAKHKELKPIEKTILKNFIKRKFSRSEKSIDIKAISWITEFSGGIPYYVQHICHEVWYASGKKADINLVNKTLYHKIIPALSSGFQKIWDRIKSDYQRLLLIALANEKEPAIYSHGFIKKYDLKSPGHVRKALESLEKARLIEKDAIWDSFFQEWVKMNFQL